MNEKGHVFSGWMGGGNYRCLAALMGMGRRFYQRGLGGIRLGKGMKAMDLGCGPGALSLALAQCSDPTASIIGIDLSEDQIRYARTVSRNLSCCPEFRVGSMDELDCEDGSLDLVMTSMALHETPPTIRRAAVREVARVLRPGGHFLLVDWSRPRWGWSGVVWYPFVAWGENNRDNRENRYADWCASLGLERVEDTYITSLVRRQVFVRAGQGPAV